MKAFVCVIIMASFILGVGAPQKLIVLPDHYINRVNAINDPKTQADYLARGVVTVEQEIGQLRSQAGPVSAES